MTATITRRRWFHVIEIARSGYWFDHYAKKVRMGNDLVTTLAKESRIYVINNDLYGTLLLRKVSTIT